MARDVGHTDSRHVDILSADALARRELAVLRAKKGDSFSAELGDIDIAGLEVFGEVDGVDELGEAFNAGERFGDRAVRCGVKNNDVVAPAESDVEDLPLQQTAE